MKLTYDGSIKFDTKVDLSGLQKGVSSLTGTLKKFGATLAIGKIAKEAFQAGLTFESAFAGVKKTVDATDAQLSQLRDGIRDMAKELPTSANEIAGVAEAAGQLGIQTDNILAFSKTMTMLGDATNMTAETAATTLARFANITGMTQDNFDRLGSTIVALGNNFATTEAEIADMGMNIASAGTQVGMTEAQIMGFATALSSVGMEAQAGGTAISKLMIDMQLATETGGESLQQFANVAGVSAEEFATAFKTDAAGAITKFITGLNDTDRHGKTAIAVLDEMGISEVRLRDAILRAANSGDLFTKAIKTGTDAWEDNTALTKEAEQRYETLESKLGMLKNNLIDLGISIYDGISEPLKDAVSGAIEQLGSLSSSIENGSLKGAIAGIGEAFGSLVGTLTTFANVVIPPLVAILGGLGQVIAPLIPTMVSFFVTFKAVNSIIAATKAIKAFFSSLSLNPYALAIAGIVAVGVAISQLAKHLMKGTAEEEAFKKRVEETNQALKERNNEYADYKKAQADTVNAEIAEIENAKKLAEELETLADEKGNIQETDKGRASFILSELNSALGTEYQLVGNQIQGYQDLANAVYEALEAKRLEAYMSAAKEDYDKTFTDETEVVNTMNNAYDNLIQKQNEYGGSIVDLTNKNKQFNGVIAEINSSQGELTQERIGEIIDTFDLAMEKENVTTAMLKSYLTDQIANNNHAIDGLQSYQDAYDEATGDYLDLLNDRNTYETAYALSAEGRTEEALALLKKSNGGYLEASEVITRYGEGTEKTLTNLTDTIKGKMLESSAVMDFYTKEGTESAKNNVVSGLGEVTDAVNEFVSQGGEITGDFVKTANGTKVDLSPFKSNLVSQADLIGTELQAKAEEAGVNLDEGLIKGIEDLEGMSIQEILAYANTILQKMEEGLEEHSPSKATERNGKWLIEGLLNGIQGTIENVFSSISDFCKTIIDNFLSFLNINTLIENGKNLLSGIISGIDSMMESVYTKVTTFATNAITKFSEYLSLKTLYNVGTDIIQGLIDGIKAMAEKALTAISEVVSPLAPFAKLLLNINSPSKLFRDEVGKSIPEGMALGISENAGLVAEASKSMAEGSVTAAKKAIDSNSPSKRFERQVGKTIPQGVALGIKKNSYEVTDAVKQMFDDLELQKEIGALSEAEYYEKLAEYRDQYLEQGTKEWWDYTKKILDYDEKMVDQQFKNLDWLHDNNIISEAQYYQKLAELRDEYFSESDEEWQDYTQQIAEYYIDTVNEIKDKFSDLGSVVQEKPYLKVNGEEGGTYLQPNDYAYATKQLNTWKNEMEKLKEKAGDDATALSIYEEVLAMDIEEGIEMAKMYNAMSGPLREHEWEQKLEEKRAYDKAAEDAAKMLTGINGQTPSLNLDLETISEETKAVGETAGEALIKGINTELEEFDPDWDAWFEGVPEQAFNMGAQMIASLRDGALSEIENFKTAISEKLTSTFSELSIGLSGGSGATTYSKGGDTYNFYSSKSTVTEQLKAAEDQSVINRLRGWWTK